MRNIFTNELELLQRLNAKDTYVLEQFLISLYPTAIEIADAVVKDNHIAQQLVHDAHLAFIKIPVEFESLQKARNYFYTSSRNAALNYIQSAHHKRWNNLSGELPDIRDDTDIETAIAKEGILKEILIILETLPEKYQQVYNLGNMGQSTDEIASQVGADKQYVLNAKIKALKKLRKILKLKNLIMLL